MTFPSYTLRPSLRASLLAFFVHHNPFYLLSALCMLAGCYSLNSGLGARAGDLGKLLALIGVLNAYEALLIGLGLYLIHRRGIVRDGRTLLLLEAPFLVDLAFLNAEAGSVSFGTGLLLSILITTLALLKIAILLRVLWGRLPARLFAFIAVTLTALLLMPSAFTWCDHHGGVTSLQCYAWWWIVGGLIAMLELNAQMARQPVAVNPIQRVMMGVYLILPLASMVGHLSMLHWVYRIQFVGADLSPVLMGIAVALGRGAWTNRAEVKALRIAMLLVAMTLGINLPPATHIYLTSRVGLTPGQITVAAAYSSAVYCFFRVWASYLISGGAMGAAMMLFGPSVEQISLAIAACYRRVLAIAGQLAPKTAFEWGFVAMGSAFAFLAMGAAVSLRKEKPLEPVTSVEMS